MPYSYPNRIPKVAKSWTEAQKKKCAKAAQAALNRGLSEEQAIYACIGAAGKSYKEIDEDAYDNAVEDGLKTFQDLITAYFAGLITLAVLKSKFNDAIELYFMELMVLGLGDTEPTQQDLDFVNGKISEHSELFDVFLADLAAGELTENRALWRAGLYATQRELYIYYTVPNAIAVLMPGLPGQVCYGQNLCGCWLDVAFDSEGNATVYWNINPEKESCEACLAMGANSPYYFTREQIENAV